MTFLRAVEPYSEPSQPLKNNIVEFSEVELILVSSTNQTELLESKLGQTQSGLCQDLRKCYHLCKANRAIRK